METLSALQCLWDKRGVFKYDISNEPDNLFLNICVAMLLAFVTILLIEVFRDVCHDHDTNADSGNLIIEILTMVGMFICELSMLAFQGDIMIVISLIIILLLLTIIFIYFQTRIRQAYKNASKAKFAVCISIVFAIAVVISLDILKIVLFKDSLIWQVLGDAITLIINCIFLTFVIRAIDEIHLLENKPFKQALETETHNDIRYIREALEEIKGKLDDNR